MAILSALSKMGRWESGLIQSPGTRPWGNSPGVRIPLCPPETSQTPTNTYFQGNYFLTNFKCPTFCPTNVQQKNKYLYKRNSIYYFSKRVNNTPIKISLKSKRAIYIDDNGRLEYPRGIIVNPAMDYKHIDYSYMPEEFVLKGSKYVILRPAFHNIEDKKLRENVQRILIIMGGTDIRNIRNPIVNIIPDPFVKNG